MERNTTVLPNVLILGDSMSATFTQLLNASDDAKYLQRLNKQEFWDLLFPIRNKPMWITSGNCGKKGKWSFCGHVLWTRLKYSLNT